MIYNRDRNGPGFYVIEYHPPFWYNTVWIALSGSLFKYAFYIRGFLNENS